MQVKIVKELAERGPCVIVGRCADYILRNRNDVLNVFIHADMEYKKKRCLERGQFSGEDAEDMIRRRDKLRPYPAGVMHEEGVNVIRPQLDEPGRVDEILHSMEEVLDNTADFARNYQSMQKALRDMTDYKNGVYSLFTPIPPAQNKTEEPVPENGQTEPLEKTDSGTQVHQL